MIQPERVQTLRSGKPAGGDYVLYWMQASQRVECNHALEYAIRRANELKRTVLVVFGLTDRYPEANERHYAFMLEGLRETRGALARRGIRLVVRKQSPEMAAVELSAGACLLVTDRGYTRIQSAWRRRVAHRASCPVMQVESDVVVPVEVASQKDEYSAGTLRPRIHKHLSEYLVPLEPTRLVRDSLGVKAAGIDVEDVDTVLSGMQLDRGAGRVGAFVGGTSNAKRLLRRFITAKLADYARCGSDPGLDIQSHQSPYIHFGQISPLYIALEVMACGAPREAVEAYLEQLIVRRELSVNFLRYNRRYRSFRSLPLWARTTLDIHKSDRRPRVYTAAQLERAETRDPYWNAAMREMLVTGKMHGYMRMYWGKKILEWTRSPAWAFGLAIRLNNKYFLDGRGPNAWNNVAWCFGLHDRAWAERSVFGKVRYMNAAGLERKFDIDAYVRRVSQLSGHSE